MLVDYLRKGIWAIGLLLALSMSSSILAAIVLPAHPWVNRAYSITFWALLAYVAVALWRTVRQITGLLTAK